MKSLFLFFLLIGYWSVVRASDTVFIKEAQVPILIERQDNLLFYLRFDARDSRMPVSYTHLTLPTILRV